MSTSSPSKPQSDLSTDRSNKPPSRTHTDSEIDTFLNRVRSYKPPPGQGRLIFALDATASRQPTWDTACALQAEMFREAAAIGGLAVQLVYFRGTSECRASRWLSNPDDLTRIMTKIMCEAGETQIAKVLAHARKENQRLRVSALIYVGDCVEEEPGDLYAAASELGVPAFMFQEGDFPGVEPIYQEIARLTKGAYCRFNAGSAQQLRELLRAVAAFAAGGMQALAARKDAGSVKLIGQLKRDGE